jgi:hypothetical protein
MERLSASLCYRGVKAPGQCSFSCDRRYLEPVGVKHWRILEEPIQRRGGPTESAEHLRLANERFVPTPSAFGSGSPYPSPTSWLLGVEHGQSLKSGDRFWLANAAQGFAIGTSVYGTPKRGYLSRNRVWQLSKWGHHPGPIAGRSAPYASLLGRCGHDGSASCSVGKTQHLNYKKHMAMSRLFSVCAD